MSVLTLLTLSIAFVWPVPMDAKATKKGDDPKPAVGNPSTMFASTEEAIYGQLKLTADQLKALRANNLAAQRSYAAIRAKFKEDGDVWAKVNAYDATAKAVKAQTKRIMTPAQHAAYVRAWDEIMAPYIANSQKFQGTTRGSAVPKK